MIRAARLGTGLLVALVAACTRRDPDANVARGRGLKPAALDPAAEAAVVNAAVHAAFDMDPSLVLMVHPRRLPRTAGSEGGDSLSSAVVRALHDAGLIRGPCEPRHERPRDTPRCPGPVAGYVVRVSDLFQGAGDTVQVNFAAEKFGAAVGPLPEALRFENIYQVTREGAGWRVVREARVRDTP